MNDLLPEKSRVWRNLEKKIATVFSNYGFDEIRTPILERTELFLRGLGEVTDIVEKEMYSFEDRLNGKTYSLRPENTAAVVRASVQHNLTYNEPRKLWYYGPMFRHERPQAGRYRQFFQFGVEMLGYDSFESEVAPIKFRFSKTAFSPSKTCTITGPEVINLTRSLKKGLALCSP